MSRPRDEIVIAVVEMELAKLEDALHAAQAEDDPDRGRLLSDHRPFQRFVERLCGMLVGDGTGPDALVRLAALTCVAACHIRRRVRRYRPESLGGRSFFPPLTRFNEARDDLGRRHCALQGDRFRSRQRQTGSRHLFVDRMRIDDRRLS